jgi:uncharacterized LabA/DUF88 family protein
MSDHEISKNIALFIDAENLIIPIDAALDRLNLKVIFNRVKEEGTLILSRAYGDWSKHPCRSYIQDFSRFGIEMTQIHSDSRGKNTADMMFTSDALEHSFQSFSADIFVVVSGDRDMVPLVQSLRRNGKKVMCICFEGSISPALKNISDTFIDYYTLQKQSTHKSVVSRTEVDAITPGKKFKPPKSVEDSSISSLINDKPEAKDERYQSFQTLLQAIKAVGRRGTPLGSNTHIMMRQLKPDFDFQLLHYETFKEFVEDAESKNLVEIKQKSSTGDFTISIVPGVEPDVEYELPSSKISFNTPAQALNSYRELLKQKRIPWLTWKKREPLIRHLWDELHKKEDGLEIYRMTELMCDYSRKMEWGTDEEAIKKLTYTLNIGKCFLSNGTEYFIKDLFNDLATPAVDVEEVFKRMHLTYLRGMKLEYPLVEFNLKAVSELLFDEVNKSTLKKSKELIDTLNLELTGHK